MKHAYRITREDSSGAPDHECTRLSDDELRGAIESYADECATRVAERGAQKAVITIERIVVDE